MALRINDLAPDFIAAADRIEAFAAEGARLIGLSTDPVEDHARWKAEIEALTGRPLGFAILADPDLKIARTWDMLPGDSYIPADEEAVDPVTERITMVLKSGADEVRLYANTATVRSTYIVGPDRRIRLSQTYPMSVGRNFDELLRAFRAVRAADRTGLDMPAQWQPGADALVRMNMPTADAEARFGRVTEYLPYYRTVTPPR